MTHWIKLYTELLDNLPMRQLSDYQYRTFIDLLLLAGRMDREGRLPSTHEIAWRLRVNERRLGDALTALATLGVIRQQPDGWLVTRFAERQARKPSDDRVAVRERKARWNSRRAAPATADGGDDAPEAALDPPHDDENAGGTPCRESSGAAPTPASVTSGVAGTPPLRKDDGKGTPSGRECNAPGTRSLPRRNAPGTRSLPRRNAPGTRSRRRRNATGTRLDTDTDTEADPEADADPETDDDAAAAAAAAAPCAPGCVRTGSKVRQAGPSARGPGLQADVAQVWSLLAGEGIVNPASGVQRQDVGELVSRCRDPGHWHEALRRARRCNPDAPFNLVVRILQDFLDTGSWEVRHGASPAGSGPAGDGRPGGQGDSGRRRSPSRESNYDPAVLAAARAPGAEKWPSHEEYLRWLKEHDMF